MTASLIGLFAGLAYLFASQRLFHQRRDEREGHGAALAIAGVAALGHTLVHVLTWPAAGPDLQFFAALSLVGLGVAALTTTAALFQRIEALGIAVYPLAALSLGIYVAIGPGPGSPLDWPLQLHAGLALLAYATLALATVMAAMLWFQEKALRQRHVRGWWRGLPPLTQLESLLFRALSVCFGLLSLALLTGVVFVADLFAQHLVHKTVLSLLSWAVLAALLFGRWRWGWRGPRAIKLTLTAMALLLLAFFGSKLVLELILQRG